MQKAGSLHNPNRFPVWAQLSDPQQPHVMMITVGYGLADPDPDPFYCQFNNMVLFEFQYRDRMRIPSSGTCADFQHKIASVASRLLYISSQTDVPSSSSRSLVLKLLQVKVFTSHQPPWLLIKLDPAIGKYILLYLIKMHFLGLAQSIFSIPFLSASQDCIIHMQFQFFELRNKENICAIYIYNKWNNWISCN